MQSGAAGSRARCQEFQIGSTARRANDTFVSIEWISSQYAPGSEVAIK
jgi:hypothetical protein